MKHLTLELSKSLDAKLKLAGVEAGESGIVFKKATCTCHPYFLGKTDKIWSDDVVLANVIGMCGLLDLAYSLVTHGTEETGRCLKASFTMTKSERRLLTVMRQTYKPMEKSRLDRLAEAIIKVLEERT